MTLTVTRGGTSFTVVGAVRSILTVAGQAVQVVTGALLNQDGSAILTESGDLILF